MEPAFSPALSAGLPSVTSCTRAPLLVGRLRLFASSLVTAAVVTPRKACATRPLFSSWGIADLAVLIGTAKPMPTLPLPLPPVAICELIPMTWPCAFSNGPPELPGLIAASVWITLLIVNLLGASIWR